MGRIFGNRRNGKSKELTLSNEDPGQGFTTISESFRRPEAIDYVPGANPEAEKFMIVPRQNIEIIQLLKSFGAETVAGVRRISVSNPTDHLLMTLPETLTISRGRIAHTNEFQCEQRTERMGIVPEIVRSGDGHVVAGFFHPFSGDFQVIGPTWEGITERFPGGTPTLLPDDVMNIKVEELLATTQQREELEEAGIIVNLELEIPEGSTWEKLLIGVVDLGNYPVRHHCRSDLAISKGFTPSSQEAETAMAELLEGVGHLHSAIRFGRKSRLEEALSKTPELAGEQAFTPGFSVSD